MTPDHSPANFRFDVVVVGAGPAGIAAACAAAESGRQVALIDETPWLGGQIWRGEHRQHSSPQARQWLHRFSRCGAVLLDQTSVVAAPQRGLLLAEHPDEPREIQYRSLVLATGARELFLPFPGWTLPGVLGPGGLQALVKHGWPIAGKRVVIAGSGPLLLAVADGLKRHGAQVISVVEQAPFSRVAGFASGLMGHPSKILQALQLKLRLFGIPNHFGHWIQSASGDGQLREVIITNGHRKWTEACDYLACGFGLVPNVELPLAVGCKLVNGFVSVNTWQATTVPSVYCAGESTGIGGADCAIVEGLIAGYAVASQRSKAEQLFRKRARWHAFRASLDRAFALRPELTQLAGDETVLCRCEDVTLGRMQRFKSWRDAKLQTRCGMGSCQGRVCGSAAKVILGWGMESVRPPVLPARVGTLISKGKQL